jgi:hypothetical protein
MNGKKKENVPRDLHQERHNNWRPRFLGATNAQERIRNGAKDVKYLTSKKQLFARRFVDHARWILTKTKHELALQTHT